MGPQQQTRCCGFAAVGPAGKSYRSIAAGAQQHQRANAGTATMLAYVES